MVMVIISLINQFIKLEVCIFVSVSKSSTHKFTKQ